MKHLIVSREFPPAPSGGIGTYTQQISRLLAESGETVHVIGQLWEGAEKPIEELCDGKLVIHRVPFEDWTSFLRARRSPRIRSKMARDLYASEYPAQCFSWQASLLAERLVEQEGIDVIEGQDYEAPLYYFQLRRTLGLGPKNRPPCIVHLHSPTLFIARYNEWNLGLPRWQVANQMETYSIQAADKLLCPSRFFARQAESQYDLPAGTIEIIPYPLRDAPKIERRRDVWTNGSVCYVGRLEKRKGILEWINAAVDVAKEDRSARFEFIGANVIGANRILSEQFVDRAISRSIKQQFTFHGEVTRSALPEFFARARIAVIPSRWDNFPNACMEAMQSGLPVIATREGGMVEMVSDGQTGWLAEEATTDGLRSALRRALATAPGKLAEMGKKAAKSIVDTCDSRRVTAKHLSLRTRLAEQGAKQQTSPSLERWPHSRTSVEKDLAVPGDNRLGFADDISQLDGHDAVGRAGQKTYSPSFVYGQSDGLMHEAFATVRCLVGNPRFAFRLLYQAAPKIFRPRKGIG